MNAIASAQSEPTWLQRRHLLFEPPVRPILDWLVDASSLTRRLQEVCRFRFEVQVLAQRRERPLRSEWRALGMRGRQWALVRQVHLLCDGVPWVYARTVVPPGTLVGRRRLLASLGTRPLGDVLFSDPSSERESLEIARLEPGQALFHFATASPNVASAAAIWGRRSLFRLSGRSLLVTEVFLPGSNPWS